MARNPAQQDRQPQQEECRRPLVATPKHFARSKRGKGRRPESRDEPRIGANAKSRRGRGKGGVDEPYAHDDNSVADCRGGASVPEDPKHSRRHHRKCGREVRRWTSGSAERVGKFTLPAECDGNVDSLFSRNKTTLCQTPVEKIDRWHTRKQKSTNGNGKQEYGDIRPNTRDAETAATSGSPTSCTGSHLVRNSRTTSPRGDAEREPRCTNPSAPAPKIAVLEPDAAL
jgi:hypothetical protein